MLVVILIILYFKIRKIPFLLNFLLFVKIYLQVFYHFCYCFVTYHHSLMMTSALLGSPIFNILCQLNKNLLFSTDFLALEVLSIFFQKSNINFILLLCPNKLFSFLTNFYYCWVY